MIYILNLFELFVKTAARMAAIDRQQSRRKAAFNAACTLELTPSGRFPASERAVAKKAASE